MLFVKYCSYVSRIGRTRADENIRIEVSSQLEESQFLWQNAERLADHLGSRVSEDEVRDSKQFQQVRGHFPGDGPDENFISRSLECPNHILEKVNVSGMSSDKKISH